MLKLYINTCDFQKDSADINNVHSFTSLSGNTFTNYCSTSTSYPTIRFV